MNLAIDIGNTRVKLGLFDDEVLTAFEVWPQLEPEQLIAWATNHRVENVILSSVGGTIAPETEERLGRNFRYLRLGPQTPLPIRNHYRTPATLGQDRLAAVVGAFQLSPYTNCLIIDAGTCITYDLLDAEGAYRGGNISPGLRMRLRAMHTFTARLPEVEMRNQEAGWLGDSTESALRIGAQLGAVLEMEGFIALCRERAGQINVFLTGGDSDFFVEKLKSKIFVNQHLVLLGLNKILTYNVKRLE